MNTNVFLGLVAFLIIAGVGYLAVSSENQSTAIVNEGSELMTTEKDISSNSAVVEITQTNDTANDSTEVIVTEELVEVAQQPPTVTSGLYTQYDAAKVASSEAEHIALFFHASWCPSCRALENDINNNAGSIPAGVEIYKADYDTEIALKQKYGITRQHSVVFIDAEGNPQSAVSHPANLAQLVAGI